MNKKTSKNKNKNYINSSSYNNKTNKVQGESLKYYRRVLKKTQALSLRGNMKRANYLINEKTKQKN